MLVYGNSVCVFNVHTALHVLMTETVIVAVGQNDREAFWDEVRDKVSQVQGQVFWLEKNPHHAED